MIGARSRCERSGATRRWPSSTNHRSPTAPASQIVNARRARGRRDASTAAPPRTTMNTANGDRKSTRLNSSHGSISYAVFCLKKKKKKKKKHKKKNSSKTYMKNNMYKEMK